jgi:hypothetical protein
LTQAGFARIKSITIYPGDEGTEEGNRIADEFFGSKPVDSAMIDATFSGLKD